MQEILYKLCVDTDTHIEISTDLSKNSVRIVHRSIFGNQYQFYINFDEIDNMIECLRKCKTYLKDNEVPVPF